MASTTKATTTTPSLTSTARVSTTTNDSETTTNTTIPTTTSLQETTALPNNTTPNNTTEHINLTSTDAPDGSNSTGAIIGGCVVGGLVTVLLVIIVIVWIRRRQRRRHSGHVPAPPPGKDFIDNLHVKHAVKYHKEHQGQEESTIKHYANLTPQGDTDEQTDPAVGPDGYLKKTKNFLNIGKPKYKKQKKGHHNEKNKTKAAGRTETGGENEPPIYTNDISITKQPAGRTNSMPNDPAPPPPRGSSEYATGRVAENTVKTNYGAESLEGYVNLQGQKKGEAVFGVAPKKSNRKNEQNNKDSRKAEVQKSNTDIDKHSGKQDTGDTDQKKVYENVSGGTYYNLNENKQQELQRQSTYEDVGAESDIKLQQDYVYENP